MQSSLPVIRTYTGNERQAAESAYQVDVRTARAAGWVPVAHRWRSMAMSTSCRSSSSCTTTRSGHRRRCAPGPEVGAARSPRPRKGEAADWRGRRRTRRPGHVPGGDFETTATDRGRQPGSSTARAHARATLETIDLHAGGEPIRLIRSGYPQVPLAPILERRRWAREHADAARQTLMYEPRGHRDMYGAVLLPPFRSDADIAVLFMHNEGYSTMCGHGVIALTTGLIEEGLYPAEPPTTTIRWETPAGLVTAVAAVVRRGRAAPRSSGVRFTNVPSYLHESTSRYPSRAAARSRCSWRSGAPTTASWTPLSLGCGSCPPSIEALTRAGAAITAELRAHHSPTHPTDTDLGFVYGTIIVDHEPGDRAGRSGHGRLDAQRDGLRGRGGRPLAVWLGNQRAPRLAARIRPAGDRARTSAMRASRARCSRAASN